MPRSDTVSDIMTEWVITVRPSDSLLTARDLMTRNRVSQLAVIDQRERPTGFISKRGMAQFLLEDSSTRPLEDIRVSEAASRTLRSVRLDMLVFNAARMFDTEGITYAVVANENPLSGIMTETDLCHYYSRTCPRKFKVSEFMMRDFIFAKGNYPAVHVAQAIVFRQPSVPVIEEELVGILTLSDLLSIWEKVPRNGETRQPPVPDSNFTLIATKDLMTSKPITMSENTDLAQAAQILINKGIGSLPVLDEEANVVGLLTKHHIVKALGTIGRNVLLAA